MCLHVSKIEFSEFPKWYDPNRIIVDFSLRDQYLRSWRPSMKNSLLVFLGLALLLSVALPLHAQDGCANSQKIQPQSSPSSALQERSLLPPEPASKPAAAPPNKISAFRSKAAKNPGHPQGFSLNSTSHQNTSQRITSPSSSASPLPPASAHSSHQPHPLLPSSSIH